jgi:hypothetical protein
LVSALTAASEAFRARCAKCGGPELFRPPLIPARDICRGLQRIVSAHFGCMSDHTKTIAEKPYSGLRFACTFLAFSSISASFCMLVAALYVR